MPKKQTYFVSVDIYVTSKSSEDAENLVIGRLNRIAERGQSTPYQVTDCGPCDDDLPA